MINKLLHVCIPIMVKKNMIAFFFVDFCMEIFISIQSAVALPVFLNLMLTAYEEEKYSIMIWYALIWFFMGVLFVGVRYYTDIQINGKFFYGTISKVRDTCLREIYYNKNISVGVDFNANPYYSFLCDSAMNFTKILFRIDRWLADTLVVIIFIIWSMRISISMSLLALGGAVLSMVVGQLLSKKANQINKQMFEQKSEMFGELHNLFWGTESFLTKGKYRKVRAGYEEKLEKYCVNNEKFARKKAMRANAINIIDSASYIAIVLCFFCFPSGKSVATIITMISVYNVLKEYLGQWNFCLLQIMENFYVVEKYCEIMERQADKEDRQEEINQRDSLIEIRDLCYFSSETKILDNINMDIKQNEKVALIGKNGAGKSTLLRCILQTITPTSGEIRTRKELSYSYIPAWAQLFPVSIHENIRYSMSDEGRKSMDDIEQAAQLRNITSTSLDDELIDGDENLSGGEAQRVAIARGIAAEYDILIADEPTANLDIKTEHRIVEELLKRANTLMYITHNPSLVKYADKVYVMDKGMVVAQGTYKDICNLSVYKSWEKTIQEQKK